MTRCYRTIMQCLTCFAVLSLLALAGSAMAESGSSSVYVPLNRSTMVTLASPATEVVLANPDIADVHVHNPTHLSVVAKAIGTTNVRVLGKDHTTVKEMDIVVGYDLPAIRKALKNFIPDETIGVEMVNNNIALTGRVRNAASVDKALKIAGDFVKNSVSNSGSSSDDSNDNAAASDGKSSANIIPSQSKGGDTKGPSILNFLQVITGQQVMLRVRVGEIQRTALKELGIDINAVGGNGFAVGTGGGIASLVAAPAGETAVPNGSFLLPGGQVPTNTQGVLYAKAGNYSALLKMLEQDGLFKLLAEPNLVAISGEEAEFLSGGELPVPVVQGSGSSATVSINYKPFGVAVKFTPIVLSENRVHMAVQPEVSEISDSNSITVSGFKIPGIETRRAKTTVELAPGESFMIAGLINDQTKATINQLPGVKDLPVLGALFRSTEFQRNETELVIAVTPYIVDPVKSSDVKLPTDEYHTPSQMELFFYGALGALSGKPKTTTPTKGPEGPTGFMVD